MPVLNPRKHRGLLKGAREENFRSNSYDLRVSRVFEILDGIAIYADNSRELPPYREVKSYLDEAGREVYSLSPDSVYQIETMEEVDLGEDVCAVTLMRSSMHKSGSSGEAGLYDSGYSGPCGMTVSVKKPSIVEKGASIFQIVFFESEDTEAYRGRYLDSQWADRLLT